MKMDILYLLDKEVKYKWEVGRDLWDILIIRVYW